jgi:hypothetical protein
MRGQFCHCTKPAGKEEDEILMRLLPGNSLLLPSSVFYALSRQIGQGSGMSPVFLYCLNLIRRLHAHLMRASCTSHVDGFFVVYENAVTSVLKLPVLRISNVDAGQRVIGCLCHEITQ